MTSPAHNAEDLLEHAVWIRNLARQLVGDGPDADDLAQDTWEAALPRQPDDTRSLRPRLARVLRNFANQGHRRKQSRPGLEQLGDHSHSIPTPEELVERGEMQAQLVQEVLALRVDLDQPSWDMQSNDLARPSAVLSVRVGPSFGGQLPVPLLLRFPGSLRACLDLLEHLAVGLARPSTGCLSRSRG